MINSSEEKAGLAMSPAVHFQPASNSSNGDIEPAAWSSPDSPSFGLARRQRRTRIIAMAGISILAVFAIAGFGVFLVTTLGGAGRTPHLKDANWKLVPQTVDDEALQSYTACTWANSTLPDFIIPRKYEVELQANLDTHQMLVFGHLIVTADILEDTPCVVFTADDQQHWQVHQHTNEYRPAGEFIIPGLGPWATSAEEAVQEVPEAGIKRARYVSLLPRLAQLHFRFKYNLVDGQRGVRVQTWPGHNNTGTRQVITYVPPKIRQALPVFDDERFKAPWNVTLVTPALTTAIFNTECIESNQHVQHLPITLSPWKVGIPDNYTAHHFQITEPLAPSEVALTLQYSSSS